MKFIGNPLDPFEPSIYTASSGFDAIHQVPETGLSETIRSDRSYVIGINPNRPVERSDHTVCIQASEESKWKPVHVYANPSRSSNKWHFGTRAKCGDPSDYSYHIGFGEMLRGVIYIHGNEIMYVSKMMLFHIQYDHIQDLKFLLKN